MLKRFNSVLTLNLFLLFIPLTAEAELFSVTIESEGQTYQNSYDSISDLIDDTDTGAISDHITDYTDDSAFSIDIDFRGLPINLSADENSSEIIMTVDSINLSEVFDGADRDESVDNLEDWFKGEGEDALTQIFQELVASTPNDPIAGNPTSVMAQNVSADFDYGSTDNSIELNQSSSASAASQEAGADTKGASFNGNMVSVFARYSNYSANGIQSSQASLPLAYSIRFNNSDNKLVFRIPVSYVVYDNSEVYNLGLGVGYSWQVTDAWNLTPAVGYSLVLSEDTGTAAQLWSNSIISSYRFDLSSHFIRIGNMLGYYSTLPVETTAGSLNPEISNTVFRNGVTWGIPTESLAKDSNLELFVTDTRYFGSELFIDQYNEIGFSFGVDKEKIVKKKKGSVSYLKKFRVGVKYLTSEYSEGYSIHMGGSF